VSLDGLGMELEDDVEVEEAHESITDIAEMIEDEGFGDDAEEDSAAGSVLELDQAKRNDTHYVEFNGRSLHKMSIIRILFNSDFTNKQSKDRLLLDHTDCIHY
jgi:hypothetical protein